jgi:hypothetical protein
VFDEGDASLEVVRGMAELEYLLGDYVTAEMLLQQVVARAGKDIEVRADAEAALALVPGGAPGEMGYGRAREIAIGGLTVHDVPVDLRPPSATISCATTRPHGHDVRSGRAWVGSEQATQEDDRCSDG